MKIAPLLFVLLLGIGCSRCERDPAPPPVDAGVARPVRPAPNPLARPTASATDLRSAIFLMYPEFRSTRAKTALVEFERVSLHTGEQKTLEPEKTRDGVAEALRKKGWTLQSSEGPGLVTAKNEPFLLVAELEGKTLRQTLQLPMEGDRINSLFSSPTTPTTENLATRFALVPEFSPIEQLFRFHLEYQASSPPKASALLTHQTRSLLPVGWELLEPVPTVTDPEAALDLLPDPTTIRLEHPSTGARLTFSRMGAEVTVDYYQPISVR